MGTRLPDLRSFAECCKTLTNEEINYGMKHFLSKMDIDSITDGQHPEFSSLDMMSMIIRGSFKRLLAENLKYTASMNKTLVEHYRDYPSKPQSFEKWHEVLLDYLGQAYSRFHEVA